MIRACGAKKGRKNQSRYAKQKSSSGRWKNTPMSLNHTFLLVKLCRQEVKPNFWG